MTFFLGSKSRAELQGVDARLVSVVERAIEITEVDFAVHDGIRTTEEQRQYVKAGTSKTMRSKHLEGRAVDLVPYIAGKLRWEWEPIYRIAAAMVLAAREKGVNLRWGGVWDRDITEVCKGLTDPAHLVVALKREVQAYCTRHPGPDFIDGPHFEVLG